MNAKRIQFVLLLLIGFVGTRALALNEKFDRILNKPIFETSMTPSTKKALANVRPKIKNLLISDVLSVRSIEILASNPVAYDELFQFLGANKLRLALTRFEIETLRQSGKIPKPTLGSYIERLLIKNEDRAILRRAGIVTIADAAHLNIQDLKLQYSDEAVDRIVAELGKYRVHIAEIPELVNEVVAITERLLVGLEDSSQNKLQNMKARTRVPPKIALRFNPKKIKVPFGPLQLWPETAKALQKGKVKDESLDQMTEDDLLKIPGIGLNQIKEIKRELGIFNRHIRPNELLFLVPDWLDIRTARALNRYGIYSIEELVKKPVDELLAYLTMRRNLLGQKRLLIFLGAYDQNHPLLPVCAKILKGALEHAE